VLEVDITHTDIDKNSLYASIGVPVFWRYDGQELQIYILEAGKYIDCDRSPTFPWIQKSYLYKFLEESQKNEIAAEIKFRALVRDLVKELF